MQADKNILSMGAWMASNPGKIRRIIMAKNDEERTFTEHLKSKLQKRNSLAK